VLEGDHVILSCRVPRLKKLSAPFMEPSHRDRRMKPLSRQESASVYRRPVTA
jgi:hypothetical protein